MEDSSFAVQSAGSRLGPTSPLRKPHTRGNWIRMITLRAGRHTLGFGVWSKTRGHACHDPAAGHGMVIGGAAWPASRGGGAGTASARAGGWGRGTAKIRAARQWRLRPHCDQSRSQLCRQGQCNQCLDDVPTLNKFCIACLEQPHSEGNHCRSATTSQTCPVDARMMRAR
jgi:hypothetical protein